MNKILVWDLPLRLFHWLLVLLVIVSYTSAKIGGNAMQLHMFSGYTILALLLFRILWGFTGGTHARFASFLAGPSKVIAYVREMRRPEAGHHVGHNPMGGWSVVLMLLALLAQIGTGLFANDDIATEGPLAKWISKDAGDRLTSFHHYNLYVLYLLIGMHVSAILFYLGFKRDNLVKPMLTGYKEATPGSGESASTPGKTWLAAVLLAICAVAVAVLVRFPKA